MSADAFRIMTRHMRNLVTTSVTLPRPLRESLCARAAAEDRSASSLMRQAIRAYLADVATPENEKAARQAAPPQPKGHLRNGDLTTRT